MTSKLTKEFCDTHDICFHPQSPDEARVIQEHLFKMGYKWRQGEQHPLYLEELANGSIHVSGGFLTCSTSGRSTQGIVCTVEQFDENYMPPEQKFIFDLFNKMSERLDKIEQRLDDIQADMRPKPMDKPAPPKNWGKGQQP